MAMSFKNPNSTSKGLVESHGPLSLSLNICWEIELFDLKTLKLTVISLGSYGMRVEYDWVLRCGSGKQSELFAIWCCEMVFFRLFLFLDVGI